MSLKLINPYVFQALIAMSTLNVTLKCVFADEVNNSVIASRLVAAALNTDVDSDESLRIKVDFAVQRMPLPTFLSDLQIKTKVPLSLRPLGELPKKLITAAGSDMKLSEVLTSLSRLYGIKWVKSPQNGYVGESLELSELEKSLLSFGDEDSWRTPEASMSGEKRQALAQALVASGNLESLKSPQGQSLSEMPLELQIQVQQEIGKSAAVKLVSKYAQVSIVNFIGSQLVVNLLPLNTGASKGRPEVQPSNHKIPAFSLVVHDAKGATVAAIGGFLGEQELNKK